MQTLHVAITLQLYVAIVPMHAMSKHYILLCFDLSLDARYCTVFISTTQISCILISVIIISCMHGTNHIYNN